MGPTPVQKGPLDASVTSKIEECSRDFGLTLYEQYSGIRGEGSVSTRYPESAHPAGSAEVDGEWRPRRWRRCVVWRRKFAETEFYGILDDLSIRWLDQIPNFGILIKLV